MFKKYDKWIKEHFALLTIVGVVLIVVVMKFIVIGYSTTEMVDAIAYVDLPISHSRTAINPQKGKHKVKYYTGEVLYNGEVHKIERYMNAKKGETVRVLKTTTKRLFYNDSIKIK